MSVEKKIKTRIKRQMHIRKKVFGTAQRPRVSVFRSNKHIYAQAIDDENSRTIAAASDYSEKKTKQAKAVKAGEVGKKLGEILLKKGIESIVFDRRGYKYHGKVKALADSLREAGLKF